MTIKEAKSAFILTACLLSAFCILTMAPGMAAEETDDEQVIFMIDDRSRFSPDAHPDHMIYMIGGFELVSEEMKDQTPGHAYVNYPGIKDMNSQEKDRIKDLARVAGIKDILSDTPEHFIAITIVEPLNYNEIGTHDPTFIEAAIEYLEKTPEYQETAKTLREIVILNQKNIEELGREIACVDIRAAGDDSDEEDSDNVFEVVEEESCETSPGYEKTDAPHTDVAFAADYGKPETIFVNLQL